MKDRPRKLGNNTLPPEGAPLCSVCQNYAYGGTRTGHHCVKAGGVWHHPSCPQLRQPRPQFQPVRPARAPSAVERMLILFRDHSAIGGIAFYMLGLAVTAAAVLSFFVFTQG